MIWFALLWLTLKALVFVMFTSSRQSVPAWQDSQPLLAYQWVRERRVGICLDGTPFLLSTIHIGSRLIVSNSFLKHIERWAPLNWLLYNDAKTVSLVNTASVGAKSSLLTILYMVLRRVTQITFLWQLSVLLSRIASALNFSKLQQCADEEFSLLFEDRQLKFMPVCHLHPQIFWALAF